ncbi:MAG: tyrosine-type recombinase/integrase [Rhodanobacter sp.]
MIKHNASNERIKRHYFTFLTEAKHHSEATADEAAAALARFEEHSKYRDFKAFRHQQAVAFKEYLTEQNNVVTKKRLSKATLHATLSQLKRFFQWLALQPGYKSQLNYSDAEYFNLSTKDSRVASARRPRAVASLEQVRQVIFSMPGSSEIEQRDRAVIAFTLLTGARDGAIASMKLKHVDLVAGNVFQDARDVKTKFSKTFTTTFFPVGGDVREIVADWVRYLREVRHWSDEDPLFPATRIVLNDRMQWEAVGVEPKHWSNATAIRRIFHDAFAAVGMPYFNPHSIRNTLVHLGETRCKTPEDFKAWSQNLGHAHVLTTFTSYGEVPARRQSEIIQALRTGRSVNAGGSTEKLPEAMVRMLKEMGFERAVK